MIWLAAPQAYHKAKLLYDTWSPLFSRVVFYSDSNFCEARSALKRCYGPSIQENPEVLKYLAKYKHQWIGKDQLIVDDIPITLVKGGGGWLMYRALIHAIERFQDVTAFNKGFLFMSDDALISPQKIFKMNPDHFWIPMPWKKHTRYSDKIFCVRRLFKNNGTITWSACDGKQSFDGNINGGLPAGHFTVVSNEFQQWTQERASLFLDKLYSTSGFVRRTWEHNVDTNLRKAWPQPNTAFNTEYALTSSFNPDIFYAPQKHAMQWLAIAKLASGVELNFDYAMASAAVGLTKDVSPLRSEFMSDSGCDIEAHRDYAAFHPCKQQEATIKKMRDMGLMQPKFVSKLLLSSTLWKDRLLRWDNRRTIPPINNFPSAPRIEVACLINDMAYSSWDNSYGSNDGLRSQMDACSFLLPRFGIHTHTVYLTPTSHKTWRIPRKIVAPCSNCSVHKSIASVPEEVSNKVEYVVMVVWKLDQLNRKQLENTLAKMKNSKLVLLVDGTMGNNRQCKLGEPAEPIQYLKNLAQNKRLAFVTLGNEIAAQRLFRYQLGVPISTLNFNGEERTLSQWAGGVSRGVLILGHSGVPSDPNLICNIAQQLGSTYKILLSSTRYTQVRCKNLPHIVNDDRPHVVKGVATLGNVPFIHNEAAVSLVFNSCPFDRMNGVSQSKIQTMLKLGLKVAVEEGEPGALQVVDLRAGEIIPRGSKANVWTAAIQRLSSSMTVQEKNRIRMEAHILFSADNTASHLAQKLFADKFA